eukprot:TRINITY_DN3680_c0_g1_i1.p2 TRINITY_DN3680_c0_g1~~TRINITY_DN3680_c0_g1_i1.p2  ORF type:complete len:105 (+),score=14.78 TRINITY_DN3680_c0_g1_i1:211-525(+)
MSTERGNYKKKGPKHQNTVAFKHNKNSKLSKKIMETPLGRNICRKCHDNLEWRKKYRKFTPLKANKKCQSCQQLKITRAYHVLCDDCCEAENRCAKCGKVSELR